MDEDQRDAIFAVCILIVVLILGACALVEFWREQWGKAIVFACLVYIIYKNYRDT